MARTSDLLVAVSIADRLGALQFTVGQVCQVANVTKMQLDYWTERGTIPTLGKKQRLYAASAVETIMLIKQARDLGLDVNAAIAAAQDFQVQQSERSSRAGSRRVA